MSETLAVPAAYVLNPESAPEALASINRIFGITPIHCVLVTRAQHIDYARAFSELVVFIKGDPLAAAIEIFKDVDQPVLVIGEAELLDAVYVDGKRQAMNV